jgi:hypothetical protein
MDLLLTCFPPPKIAQSIYSISESGNNVTRGLPAIRFLSLIILYEFYFEKIFLNIKTAILNAALVYIRSSERVRMEKICRRI